MQKPQFFFQNPTAEDIAKVAEYIHETDKYIYPLVCRDPLDGSWQEFIGQCLMAPDNFYNSDYITLIKSDGETVGLAAVVPCGRALNFCDGIRVPKEIQNGIDTINQGYFQPLVKELRELCGSCVVNICVDRKHRQKGIGTALMKHCVELYGDKPMHLDVVAENTSALRLYRSFGFEVEREYEGFAGERTVTCLHMVRK